MAELLDHEVDGIQEYDNPPPAWLVWLFNLSILFAAYYVVVYPSTWFWHGTNQWSSGGQYQDQMEAAQAHYGPLMEAARERAVEAVAQLVEDEAALAGGQQVFALRCAPCHGENAEGKIGPSLIDDTWLYGSEPKDVIQSISEGRPKGMPPWANQLSTDELNNVAAYVLSIRSQP